VEGLTEPVVNPEIRNYVPNEQAVPSPVLVHPVKGTESDRNAEIAEEDETLLLLLVQGAGRPEVVYATKESVHRSFALTLRLSLVVVMASDIGEEVELPASKLLSDHVDERSHWGLLCQLVDLMQQTAGTSRV
jgi:hypothetical protein